MDEMQEEFVPSGRNYRELLAALEQAFAVILGDAPEPTAQLREAFKGAVTGFGAEKAVLLTVEGERPLQLKAVFSEGLSGDEVTAIERGQSVRGVSSTVVRKVLASGEPILECDPRFAPAGTPAFSSSIAGGEYSVLAAPIPDPTGGRPMGIVYLQNTGYPNQLHASDEPWLRAYARAVGWSLYAAEQRERLTRDLERRLGGLEIVGESPAMLELRRELHEVWIPAAEREFPDPVLILGPTGAGKDLVARYVHAYSSRRKRPFVTINCATLGSDTNLTVARLFGHRRGAFTGADRDNLGLIASAEGGVLLLDEVGELKPEVQGQMLRWLDTHLVQAVGDSTERRVDVYVFLATNQDPAEMVASGGLKHDLYERFKMQSVVLPPLAQRPADILPLAHYFLAQGERAAGKRTLGFDPAAQRLLLSYSWRGNVREVARLVSAVVTRTPGGQWITVETIGRINSKLVEEAQERMGGAPEISSCGLFRDLVRDFQRRLILDAMRATGGSKLRAAQRLGLANATFSGYLRDFGLAARRRVEEEADGRADEA